MSITLSFILIIETLEIQCIMKLVISILFLVCVSVCVSVMYSLRGHKLAKKFLTTYNIQFPACSLIVRSCITMFSGFMVYSSRKMNGSRKFLTPYSVWSALQVAELLEPRLQVSQWTCRRMICHSDIVVCVISFLTVADVLTKLLLLF